MTDKKYLITEAQIEELSKVFPDNDWGQTLEDMLQSLPMVTDTPKAYILQNSEDSHKKLSWVENVDCESIPLFTSPQALTPITADDVTDEMLEAVKKAIPMQGVVTCEKVVAIYNAVLKHRSEAR